LNEQQQGFILKSPLKGGLALIGDSVTLECRIRDHDKLSCDVDLEAPNYFEIIKEGAVFVAKHTAAFFQGGGEVIAAVAEDLVNDAVGWTEDAVHDTAKRIADGVYNDIGGLAEGAFNHFVDGFSDL